MMSDVSPKRTPLFSRHRDAGAKLVEFAGWEMPVRYSSEIEEHRAVRSAAGIFDVSHMGQIRVRGRGAAEFLQRLTPNNIAKLSPGVAHYSGLLTPEATYIDDLLVYHLAESDYLLVVNAGNTPEDLAWILEQPHGGCDIEDQSDQYALLAIQGPKALEILGRHTGIDLPSIRYYHFVEDRLAGAPCLFSRTGYTGEDGFELYLPPESAPEVWDLLCSSGAPDGLIPAGLGARDTLRLEAGMALYGHEIDRTTTPYEAGLGWVVKLKKGDFIGRSVLVDQKKEGARRSLVGLEITGRGIARQGHRVLHGGEDVGEVVSGTWGPTLEKAIATAYVPRALAVEGTEVRVQVRRREIEAVVSPMPFYRRPREV